MGDPRQHDDDTGRIDSVLRESYHRTIGEYEAKHGAGSWANRITSLPRLPEGKMLELIEKRLDEYSRLEADWDGYSASPASAESLRDARIFIGHRPQGLRLPYPALETNGEVGFTWEFGNVCADVILEGDGTFHYLARVRDKDGSESECSGEDCRADSEWPEDLVRALEKID